MIHFFSGYEESAHAADEANEGGLGEVPALEEQEGQGGPAAEGKGLWKSFRRKKHKVSFLSVYFILF